MQQRISPLLASTEVFSPDGQVHRVGEFYEREAAVLVFLRHFG